MQLIIQISWGVVNRVLNCTDTSSMSMQWQARDSPKSGAHSGWQHHCQAADVAGAQGPGIREVLHRLPLHPQLHLCQPPHGPAARPAPHPRIRQAPGRHVQRQGRDRRQVRPPMCLVLDTLCIYPMCMNAACSVMAALHDCIIHQQCQRLTQYCCCQRS